MEFIPQLLKGAVVSLELTVLGVLAGWLLGLFICLLKISSNRVISGFARGYIALLRGLPFLVLCMFIYYGSPILLGFDIPPFLSGVTALAVTTSAFSAEIIRGGIMGIAKGQKEAAESLGFNSWQTMRHIVLPQSLLSVLPQLTNEFSIVLKNSSLVMVISLTELTFTASQIVGVYFNPTEIYLATALLYFIMTFSISTLARYIERRKVNVFR
ncbi:amino acid ABC transporter permease [Paenibacillus beijingensis]|uniref:ABC transmembrane type-1 domain-containing protein n=1 Tax=Paenibacillus beijingensis TaxID=1126833 RepID=A0A0D5NQG1_9BACL|nr:amino acid ABC transporter permease [Paenibacillus beijingensis]AJY77415.1 hypothetical protein VN24_01260 [Paenibacillus beijingensis]